MPNIPSDVLGPKWEAVRKIQDPAARKAAAQALVDGGESTQQRLFIGKWRNDSAVLVMSDLKGRPRLRMQVAADGAPRLEFLDEAGAVTYSLPGPPAPPKP